MRRPKPAGSNVRVAVPVELHPATKDLVQHFATAIAFKLREAEEKYGYGDGWRTQDWEVECRQHMYDHMAKGDPRDMAIYAAFMWSRKWSTAPKEIDATSKMHIVLGDKAVGVFED
jgi:hypothetical protein